MNHYSKEKFDSEGEEEDREREPPSDPLGNGPKSANLF